MSNYESKIGGNEKDVTPFIVVCQSCDQQCREGCSSCTGTCRSTCVSICQQRNDTLV
jgi:hypothetical protein